MRLDFNVLWVDDQPNAVSAQIDRIRLQMKAEGFNFNPTQCKTLAEVELHIAEEVFRDEVDLILVDWDLGGGMHGQNVIARVREVAQYKDVVFYSAQTPTNELRRLVFEGDLEGIYCASREGLVDEVLGVFESLVKKVLDLDHTRGIVMGATSDIDHLVNACLTKIHAQLDEEGQEKFIGTILKRITDKVADISKKGEKLKGDPSLEEIFKAHMLFTSDDRLRALSALLKENIYECHGDAKKKIEVYRAKVVPKRNSLGHMVFAPEGKPQAVATNEGAPVSLEEMRDLRKLILSLREDFRTLANELGG